MFLTPPNLAFPGGFCCNCGDTNCMNELQDTRVTRYFGIGGTETTFQLPVPVCAACRKTTRRRPSGLFAKLLVLGMLVSGLFLGLTILALNVVFPAWLGEHLFWVSAGLALVLTIVTYRLRRPRPPQTSFYQPVRIREVNVQVTDVLAGEGHVAFMKLAFTNPAYLEAFTAANRDAIQARHVAAVRA